jgi:multimeric flavodoxin WrbA
MRLTVFNGSPRGEDSNTKVFLEHFINGFTEQDGNSYELAYLNRVKKQDEFINMFCNAEHVLIAFPLYTDTMPAIVKTFIESLALLRDNNNNPSIGFLVQCGFPEAIHIRAVEKYLEKLAKRLGSKYTGTIVKGGGEGAKYMPKQYAKVFSIFYQLGQIYGNTGGFDTRLLGKLAKPEKFPKLIALMFKPLLKTKPFKIGWDNQLKENDVFEKRFARPYHD